MPDGVTLTSSRGAAEDSTAELAVGLLLAGLRGVPEAAAQQQRRTWAPPRGRGGSAQRRRPRGARPRRGGAELVGHGAVVARRIQHGHRHVPAGYVEGLAVRADYRGHGHGAALLDALEVTVRARFDAGALSTTEMAAGFYAARGWSLRRGPTAVLTPSGVVRTPEDDGGVYVLPVSVPLDLDGELVCDWRPGDVW